MFLSYHRGRKRITEVTVMYLEFGDEFEIYKNYFLKEKYLKIIKNLNFVIFDILICGLRSKFQDLCDYVLDFGTYMVSLVRRLWLVDTFKEAVGTWIVVF
jgi:hypothetical protein